MTKNKTGAVLKLFNGSVHDEHAKKSDGYKNKWLL